MNGGRPRRFYPYVYRIKGKVDMHALRSALDMLSASQPALRTVFFERDGEVFQLVKTNLPILLEPIKPNAAGSLEWLPDDEFISRPFDLENGPLIRVGFMSRDEDSHVLCIIMHHIIMDGHSNALAVRDLSRFYNEAIAGRPLVPDENGNGVGEDAQKEKEWLASEEGKAAIDYWKGRLDLGGMGHPWPVESRHRKVLSTVNQPPGILDIELDADLSRRIRLLTASKGSTVFRFLLGTYLLSLQGLLPERAVTVAMPVNLRRTPEELKLIGCLIGSLPLTMEANASESAEEYLILVERIFQDAFRNVRVPGPMIIDEWRSQRGIKPDVGQKTFFNFKKTGKVSLNLHGTTSERIMSRKMFSSADLDIELDAESPHDSESPLRLALNFDEKRLSRSQVEWLLEVWISVMRYCTEESFKAGVGEGVHLHEVYAFAGGTGGFDEHACFHRLGEYLGGGWRVKMMPDPESSFGRLPVKGVRETTRIHAERIAHASDGGKVWLLGEGIGGVDAHAVACALQSSGVADLGLILFDSLAPGGLVQSGRCDVSAVESYWKLPERLGKLAEGLYDLRLRAAVRLNGMTYPVPLSRLQVFRASLAYGLFDSAFYGSRYGFVDRPVREMFDDYLGGGSKSSRLSSGWFHAHRYRAVNEVYVPGTDDPVLHALLIGMRQRNLRRKLVGMSRESLGLDDVVSARSFLRMVSYSPCSFRGEVHVVTSRVHEGQAPDLGWGRHVEGVVRCRSVDAGVELKTEAFAGVMRSILVT